MTSIFSWDIHGAGSGAFLPGVGEDIDSDVGGSGGRRDGEKWEITEVPLW